MPHLEVLVEDRSGLAVVRALFEPLLASRPVDWTLTLRPHRGIGRLPRDWRSRPAPLASGLLDLLPAKLRAYAGLDDPAFALLVVLDADEESPEARHEELALLGRVLARELPFAAGVAVEEMEAWILGDRAACLAAWPEIDRAVLGRYEQDSICGTWEHLARALLGRGAERLIRAGYPAVGAMKAEWAAAVAPHLEPSRNRSPSFRRSYRAVAKLLERVEAQQGAG